MSKKPTSDETNVDGIDDVDDSDDDAGEAPRRARMRKDDVLWWIFDRLDREQEERIASFRAHEVKMAAVKEALTVLVPIITKTTLGTPILATDPLTADLTSDVALASLTRRLVSSLDSDQLNKFAGVLRAEQINDLGAIFGLVTPTSPTRDPMKDPVVTPPPERTNTEPS